MHDSLIVPPPLLPPVGAVAEHAPAISLECEETWSYGHLRRMVNAYANGLLELGVRPGDRVGVLLSNSPQYWALYLAVLRVRAIAVRLNWRLTEHELGYALRDSGVGVLAFHGRFASVVATAVREGRLRSVRFVLDEAVDAAEITGALEGELPESALEGAPGDGPAVAEPNLDDPCMIMYTSGTTGFPKGALWSHGHTRRLGRMELDFWGYTADVTHLVTTPMFHVSGLEGWAMPTLMAGGHTVLMRSGGLTAGRMIKVMERHRVTDTFVVPATIYSWLSDAALADVKLPHLRRLITGGSPILGWALDQLAERLPHVSLEQSYGLTEGGAITCIMLPKHLAEHPTSVGEPIPPTRLRVVDPSTGLDVALGEAGELWTSSPSVCGTYWGKPEATAETFVDGWCRTGDVVTRGTDGVVTVVGRVKDMIISGGENVYPREIEMVLGEHPDVLESAVIGIPDRKYGETPCAVIVPTPGHTVDLDDIARYCRERLAGYKQPRHVAVVDELPRNAAGKVLKRQLRDTYEPCGALAVGARSHES